MKEVKYLIYNILYCLHIKIYFDYVRLDKTLKFILPIYFYYIITKQLKLTDVAHICDWHCGFYWRECFLGKHTFQIAYL